MVLNLLQKKLNTLTIDEISKLTLSELRTSLWIIAKKFD